MLPEVAPPPLPERGAYPSTTAEPCPADSATALRLPCSATLSALAFNSSAVASCSSNTCAIRLDLSSLLLKVKTRSESTPTTHLHFGQHDGVVLAASRKSGPLLGVPASLPVLCCRQRCRSGCKALERRVRAAQPQCQLLRSILTRAAAHCQGEVCQAC